MQTNTNNFQLVASSYQKNSPKNIQSKFSDGFVAAEWWQVLTIVTAILSLGSILLSINQAQPEAYRNEFLMIDQTKASVYLIYHQQSRQDSDEVSFINKYNKTQLCQAPYSSSISSTDLEEKTDNIRQSESHLQEIEKASSSKLRLLADESRVSALLSDANTYLVEKRLYFEKKYLLAERQSEIYSSLSTLCVGVGDKTLEVNKISSSLEEISALEGIDRSKSIQLSAILGKWEKNPSELDFSYIFGETQEVDTFVSELDKIDNFYQQYASSKKNIQAKFINLEKWQVAFANKNSEFENSLILIDEFQHDSAQ